MFYGKKHFKLNFALGEMGNTAQNTVLKRHVKEVLSKPLEITFVSFCDEIFRSSEEKSERVRLSY